MHRFRALSNCDALADEKDLFVQHYEWYDLGRFCNKSMGQIFVEGDEMSDVNITVVLLEKNILADLISAWKLASVSIEHVDFLACK